MLPPVGDDELREDEAVLVWPLFRLRLRTSRLELRLPREHELASLALAAPDDLELDPAWPAPSASPRTRSTSVAQGWWRAMGSWSEEHWRCPFAVFVAGALVGFQELEGRRFAVLRQVETSSWLTRETRGHGVGKEMRAAVLALAFEHLGAEVAVTSAWETNDASRGVSTALGYVDNGWDLHERDGTAARMSRASLARSSWDPSRWPTTVEGLEACRGLFAPP